MKKIKALLLVLMAALVLAACGGDKSSEEPADTSDDAVEEESNGEDAEDGEVFTLEELSEYDGKDGNPAYVAVDGVVYDVSDIGVWADGEHFSGVEAGQDNTDRIGESPHGESVLEDLPVVGTLE